ncbi:threonine ammonia-lyase, biosynthetic [Neisseriaceae bacterium CLB008]
MTNTHQHYLKKILTASVYDVATETPLDRGHNLSRRLNNNIFLKREDLQPVFSFKIRGAYNKMANLSDAELAKGVITASAGNHAQGVALSAKVLGCEAVVVMPATTPQIKIDAVQGHGAKVVLHGNSFSDAYEHAMSLVATAGKVYIPPFDDPDVIAGQGTVGMEIVRQHHKKIDAIFVPIGGGGIAAGVAAYIKNVRPDIKVIGVEPVDSCGMYLSIKEDRLVSLSEVGLFADGVAVKQMGEETFKMCRDLLDEIIMVDTDAMCSAIKDIFEDTRSITEPAGALALAGLKAYIEREGAQEQTLVAICTGANMNFDRLGHVSERTELSERREAILAVTIPETPGSFKRFCQVIGQRSVTEFNYRFGTAEEAHIFVGIQTSGRQDIAKIMADLAANDFGAIDLTDEEMAKIHIRHMVGGRSDKTLNERVFSFEFPEQPGALLRFLEAMQLDWNISLFHYRNHGADFGRVLVGVEVPEEDHPAFEASLLGLGYAHKEETQNPAYQLFLRGNP